jgi:two-component system, cell cycle sensor histidine kinase and response regulator CckA
MPHASRIHVRPLAAIAALVAASAPLIELAAGTSLRTETRAVWVIRGVEIVVALAVGALGWRRRSPALLRALTFVLALDIAAANVAIAMLLPARLWETSSVQAFVLLAAALFSPWSWRWQLGLAVAVMATAIGGLLYLDLAGEVAPTMYTVYAVILLIAAAAGVLGTYLAERERRRVFASEARYRALFESAGDGIAVLDPHGVVLQANERLASLLGVPPKEIVGSQLGDFEVGAGAEAEFAAARNAALSGALRQLEGKLRRAGGKPVEVSITLARVDAAEGPLVQATVRDLTEHRALERRRGQEQRLDALSRLAGGLAHQFNNLLGGIITHVSVLREDPANAAAAAELDEVLEAARRGRALTRELARFDAQSVVAPRPAQAAQVLEGLAALARSTFPGDVAIEVRSPDGPPLPPMLADPDHLLDAGVQLLLNARDAMRGRPYRRLVLSAAVETIREPDKPWPGLRPGPYVRISIADTGHGMDSATIERVFEPFFSTKPLHEASGLGLATVHRVLRAHNGAVGIESAPGRGTTVHLFLPVAPAGAAAEPVAARIGGTVLIVDDEDIVRSSLRRALTRFGCRVLEASDGPTAMAQMKTADPPVDLVILDLVLPGGGAAVFELLKAVRPDVKVLISSGHSPDAEVARGLASRADGFLPKPYEIPQLRAVVTDLLKGAA